MKLNPQQIGAAANSEFSRFAGLYGCEAIEQITDLMRLRAKSELIIRGQSKKTQHVLQGSGKGKQ